MPEKLMGWIGLAVFVAVAIGLPLILLGVPEEYIWPISLASAAIMLVARPGGTTEKFLTNFFAYALVFALWCVAGILVAVVLHLALGIEHPDTLFVVLGVGAIGTIREAMKSPSGPPKSDA